MKHTTLCYLENERGQYLMMHRVKKLNDENEGKWVGIGGKMQQGESPFDCARREILEETGLSADKLIYRGFITFVSEKFGTEYMHLFTCREYTGQLQEDCPEGVLSWVNKKDVLTLPLWEGDAVFLALLEKETPFFSLKLEYDTENRLIKSVLE